MTTWSRSALSRFIGSRSIICALTLLASPLSAFSEDTPLLSIPSSGGSSARAASLASSTPTLVRTIPYAGATTPENALFGLASVELGDIDSDPSTITTVAVGAPGAADGSGQVELLSFDDAQTIVDRVTISPVDLGLIDSLDRRSYFGSSITVLPLKGTVAGAVKLIAVGMPGELSDDEVSGGFALLWLSGNGAVLASRVYSAQSAGCALDDFDFFGASLTLLDDATLIVAAPTKDTTGEDVGALYRLGLDGTGSVTSCDEVVLPSEIATSLQPHGQFGQMLTRVGAVERNGTTYSTIAIASARQEAGAPGIINYLGSTIWFLGFNGSSATLLDSAKYLRTTPIPLSGSINNLNLGNVVFAGSPRSYGKPVARDIMVGLRTTAPALTSLRIISLRNDGEIGNITQYRSGLPGATTSSDVLSSLTILKSSQNDIFGKLVLVAGFPLASEGAASPQNGILRLYAAPRSRPFGRLATILLTLSDPGVSPKLAKQIVGNVIKYSALKNPKVLVIRDDATNGEDINDPVYIASLATELGYDVTFIEEPSFGIRWRDIIGYDVVLFSNPGFPVDDTMTIETLQYAQRRGIHIGLFGDDMAWPNTKPLIHLEFENNGTSTCGVGTDNNAGPGKYRVQVETESHPLIAGFEGEVFLYGNDIDHSRITSMTRKVLAWATLDQGNGCQVRTPVIIAGPAC